MKALLALAIVSACTGVLAQKALVEWGLKPTGGATMAVYPTQAACLAVAQTLTPPDRYSCEWQALSASKAAAVEAAPRVATPPADKAPAAQPTFDIPGGDLPAVNMAKLMPAAVGASKAQRAPAPPPFHPGGLQAPNPSDEGAFRIACKPSHMNKDDALVFPGRPGASHLHVYFGNVGVNAFTTPDALAATGNSTCSGGVLNRSAYWVPAMIDTTDGSPVPPSSILVYYKTGYGGVRPADVRAVPKGLRFISGQPSGNASSPSRAGRFACVGGDRGVGWQKSIPTRCYQNNSLIMEVGFPQCWDGRNLDSPDHKSHLAEATGRGCPASHPVALPAISYEVYYDLSKVNLANMARWRLSSDNYPANSPGGYSAHGDYMMGWDEDVMEALIKNCDNASFDCHTNLLGDGTWLY